jgi:predicted anti-sigma-YlaC factor YlaD
MHCSTSQELVSADLDGELAPDERRLLARHLHRCADCRRYSAAAADLHRGLRVQPAPPVPDLTEAILARLDAAGPAPGRATALYWRVGLALVGLAQLLLAGPAFVAHPDVTHEQQALYHLNAWAVAFAVGLLVVAWQPWRVRGVLPIAATLAAVMVFTVALDIHNGHTIGMPATAHLLELAGLMLAWGLSRHLRGESGGDPAGGDRRSARHGWASRCLPAGLRPGGPPGAWARDRGTHPAVARGERRDRAA